ncbi:MAG: hypothetical protein RLZ97_1328 [Verrucomicrobiota bacterium]
MPPPPLRFRAWLLFLLLIVSQEAMGVRHLIKLDLDVNEATGEVGFGIEREDELGPAMEVHRRIEGSVGAASWQWRATLPRTTTTWTDGGLVPGVIYEYRFFVPADQDFPNPTAAYVSCAIRAPLVDAQGKVLLVVDNTVASALSVELGRFIMDLRGDGWTVERLDFGRHGSATPEALRAAIQSRHATSPLSSIILFGHLPVVLSGLIRPDEHEFYRQATDLFYADVDGVWQDTLSTSFPDQTNHYPGDGNYDHDTIPGPNQRIEIPIGRIDMADMPAWSPLSETELLRRYLNKNHHFRHCRHQVPREVYFTSMAYDDSPLEAAAAVAMLGPENGVEAYDNGETEQSRPLLWGIAGRDWNGANYPGYRFKSHFTVNFASGKQAWEWENNQMRAMLAMPWYGLTCTWGVRPNWLFHFAGMGKTLGYCNYRTANNNNNSTPGGLEYPPVDDFNDWLDGYVHINLMGDPTLRIHPVPPVRLLTASVSGAGRLLSWQAPDDFRVLGFHVYRATNVAGPYTRLTSEPIAKLSYLDAAPPSGAGWYMVRPVKWEITPAGSYLNAGQGSFIKIQGSTINRPPTPQNWSYTIFANTTKVFTPTMTDPDGDTVKCFIAAPPASGDVTGTGPSFTYQPPAGFTGVVRIPVTAWDGLAESQGTVTIQVGVIPPPAPLSYSTWASGINWQGKSSLPTADANGDGVSNAMEFHLARNPVGPRSPWFSRLETIEENGHQWWVIEFRRRKNHPALTVRCSSDGQPWWSTLVADGRDVIQEVFPNYFPTSPEAELVRLKWKLRPGAPQRMLRLEGAD